MNLTHPTLLNAYHLYEEDKIERALEILESEYPNFGKDFDFAQVLMTRCYFEIAVNIMGLNEDGIKYYTKGKNILDEIIAKKKGDYTEEESWAIVNGIETLAYYADILLNKDSVSVEVMKLSQEVNHSETTSKYEKFRALLATAHYYSSVNNFRSIISVLNLALVITDDAPDEEKAMCYALLARAHTSLQEEVKALEYLKKSRSYLQNWDKQEYPLELRHVLESEIVYINFIAQDQIERKLELYNELIEIAPDAASKAIYFVDKGSVEIENNMYDDALSSFQSAIGINPDDAIDNNAYRYAGRAAYLTGNLDLATQYYEKPLPTNSMSDEDIVVEEIYRGSFYNQIGKVDLAKKSFRNVLENNAATIDQKILVKKLLEDIK